MPEPLKKNLSDLLHIPPVSGAQRSRRSAGERESTKPPSSSSTASEPIPTDSKGKKRAISGSEREDTPPKKKSKKTKPKKLKPFEYAKVLSRRSKNNDRTSDRLKGHKIFFLGGEGRYNVMSENTWRKMDLIVEHGGEIVPEFDPNVVTHIVLIYPTDEELCLEYLPYDELSDIPQSIPTLGWEFIADSVSPDQDVLTLESYAYFMEREGARKIKQEEGIELLSEVEGACTPLGLRASSEEPLENDQYVTYEQNDISRT